MLARESKVSAKHSSIPEDAAGLSVAKTTNQPAGGTEELLLAADPTMLQIRSLARRVAPTDAPVLIVGESGVGKEVLARFIHAESARAAQPFVKINCAALPPDLLESELFGYELGAFTGAHQRKVGRLELADGGTLLLDEIGEMSPSLQAKLLHVLEDRAFARVGSTEATRVDARIIATSNTALEEAVRRGEFRKDLYFRLKAVGIDLPPLRARPADIPLLSERFLRLYRDGQATSSIPDRLLEGLQRYSWPGNVRELKHVIQRYTIFPDVDMVLSELTADERAHAPGDRLERDVAEVSVDSERNSAGDFVPSRNGRIPLKSIAIKAAEDAEKRVILQVLAQTRWNRRRAAARLDICYKTLLNKINHWHLERDH